MFLTPHNALEHLNVHHDVIVKISLKSIATLDPGKSIVVYSHVYIFDFFLFLHSSK